MLLQCSYSCKFPALSIFSSAGWRWRYPVGARSRFLWKLHPSSQAWPLLSTSNRGETAIAKCGNSPVLSSTVVLWITTCIFNLNKLLNSDFKCRCSINETPFWNFGNERVNFWIFFLKFICSVGYYSGWNNAAYSRENMISQMFNEICVKLFLDYIVPTAGDLSWHGQGINTMSIKPHQIAGNIMWNDK